jgi:DSF synthase
MSPVVTPILQSRPEATPWRVALSQLTTSYDPQQRVLTYLMQPHPRPSFTPDLLRDIERFQQEVRERVSGELRQGLESSVRYLVHASAVPGVFNLGGDLSFFLRTIRAQDRQTLTEYAHLSIRVLHANLVNLGLPVTTVALLEGTTLGAAFEAALSSDVIIAERSVQIGFPEVVFNMFPGMGAYSFLARRLSPAMVEQMIMSGKLYTAQELHSLGVIDVLAEDGQGKRQLQDFIQKDERTRVTRKALLRMRERVHPITFEELIDIADIWVDSALSLPEKDLRMMERLVKAQDRRMAAAPEPRWQSG